MEQSSFQDEQTVRHQFDSLCKLALKSEVINYEKHMAYRQKYEVMLSELSEKELSRLFIMDEHEMETHRFQVLGYDIEVKDALIAEALQTLTEKKRNVVLLSYFMDMSDADIAREMNLVRSTINEHELFAQVRFPAYYTCFEDAIIHFLVFRLAKTVASVPEMVYLWRKNPKGLTATSQHRPAAVQSYWIMERLAVQDAALGLPHDALYRCSLTLQLSAFCYATVSGLPPETQQAVFRLCCALYAKALPQEGALPRRARWGARALRQQDFGLWCRYGRRFQLL